MTLLLMQDASSLEPFGQQQREWRNPKYGLVKSCKGSWTVVVVCCLLENESTDANVPSGVTPSKRAWQLDARRLRARRLCWSDSLLMSADRGGPRERNCLVAEATKKGIQLMLLNDKRVLHTSAVPSSGQSSLLAAKLEE